MNEHSRTPWKIILAGWMVYAMYMAITAYVVSARLGSPVSVWHAITGDFSYAAVWILLTPLVLRLAQRWRFERGLWLRSSVLHLVASILLAVAHKAIHGVLFSLYRFGVDGVPISWDLQYRQVLSYFDYGVQLYWLIIILAYAYEYHGRYRQNELLTSELERQLADARLQALKRQLQPHFLFNTLHAIAGLVRTDEKQKAVTMIAGLSDLLRSSLDTTDRHEITLRKELELLEKYLDIEGVRFSDRLRAEVRISPETLDVLVPNLILQPLVENAIKHGLGLEMREGKIEIRAERSDDHLQIVVRDNGTGLASAAVSDDEVGVGLANTRERLQNLYGTEHSFTLESERGGGVCARIRVPWRTRQRTDGRTK